MEGKYPVMKPVAEPGPVTTSLGDATDVESGATYVRFRLDGLDNRPRRTVTMAAALPPGRTPTVELKSFHIRQVAPWDTGPLDDRETSAALGTRTATLNRLVKVTARGIARRTHLFQITVSADLSGITPGRRYSLTDAEIVLRWSDPWSPVPVADQAYKDPKGPWMQTLGGLVLNPSALTPYADPAPPIVETKPALPGKDWQPKPVKGVAQSGWIKIPVEDEGLYSIGWYTLKNAGWDPDTIEPSRLRIFNEGVEIPTYLEGGFAKHFTVRDHLVFWGVPSASPSTRTNAYFLSVTPPGESPLRYTEPGRVTALAPQPLEDWTVDTRVEENKILETKEGNFLSIRDMRLVWETLPPRKPVTIPFDLPGYVAKPPNGDSKCRIRVLCYIGKGNLPPNADLEVTVNGKATQKTRVVGGHGDPIVTLEVDPSLLHEKGNEAVLLWRGTEKMTPLFLDAIEVRHVRRLDVSSGPLILNLKERSSTASLTLRVTGARASSFLALDLADPLKPLRLPVVEDRAGGSVDVAIDGAETGRIGLFDLGKADPAPSGYPPLWRPWRTLDPEADSIIITYSEFRKYADKLADTWKSEGRKPLVVDVESLYDAYTLGLLDPAAIRMFLADAMRRWTRKPEVVLLVGDCTSDYRNRAHNQVINYVPTYSHPARGLANQDRFASDLWYAQVLGDDHFADLLIGRLSVDNLKDAETVVDKQIASRKFPRGLWAQSIGLVADHGNFDDVCEDLRLDVLPPTVLPRLAYLDREPFQDNFYLSESLLQGDEVKVSPATTRRIQDLFEDGSVLVAFFGHGSPNIWSDQRIWFGGDSPNSDNRRLHNAPYYPLLFNGTCNTGAIDYPVRPWNICITEDMMRQPGGGALACFVPSAPGFTSNHKLLAEALFRSAFVLSVRRIGPLCELSRMSYQMLESSDDHSQMFNLLGDPLASLPSVATRVAPLSVAGSRVSLPPQAASPARGTGKSELFVIGPDGDFLKPPVKESGAGTNTATQLPTGFHGRAQLVEWNQRKDAAGDEGGGTLEGGAAYIGPHPVSVRNLSVYRPARRPGIEEKPGFLVTLKNKTRFRTTGTLHLQDQTKHNRWETVGETHFDLPSQGNRTVHIDASLAPGVHLLRASIKKTPSVEDSPDDIREPMVDVVPVPGRRRDVAIRTVSLTPMPRLDGKFVLNIQATAANLGTESWPGGEAKLYKENPQPAAGKTPASKPTRPESKSSSGLVMTRELRAPVKPGESVDVSFSNIPVDGRTKQTWHLILTTSDKTWSDEDASNNSTDISFDPSMLPDLAIVPGSLTITPKTPTEGETVFLTAELENRGHSPTPRFSMAGLAYDKKGKKSPMPDRADVNPSVELPLAPGARRKVRVRWDPRKNLDIDKVALVADSNNKVADLNRANNTIESPIHVLSKWKLVPLGITIRDRTAESVVLVARIRNEGETPARFVEVAFYPDQNHSKENLLGVEMKDIIEPGQTADFTYKWHVRPQDVGRKVQPSFDAYIKGSLLRVTGTAMQ